MGGSIPAKASGVDAIAAGKVIGARITGVDETQKSLVGTDSRGIKARVGSRQMY